MADTESSLYGRRPSGDNHVRSLRCEILQDSVSVVDSVAVGSHHGNCNAMMISTLTTDASQQERLLCVSVKWMGRNKSGMGEKGQPIRIG